MSWFTDITDQWPGVSKQLGLPDLAPKAPAAPTLDIPPPPAPAITAPANDILSPILGDSARDAQGNAEMVRAKKRGTQSLTIDLSIGGMGGAGTGTGINL